MADKGELAKAGTMDLTAKDGKAYLEKNLTEWKKPGLLSHFNDEDGSGNGTASKGKKGAKKAAMAKAGTMAVTAKEGKELLGEEKLGDTRLMTNQTKKKTTGKASAKRANTMARVVEEAKAVCGPINTSEGRKLRKRSAAAAAPLKPKKSPMKKARTMVNTAKEGKAFLKKGGK